VGAGNAPVLTGLVVGKFSPLHAGHQALIAFAEARCDRLILLSYSSPELPGCPAARREAWLAALCPQAVRLVLDDARVAALARERAVPPRPIPANDAPDADQRAFVGWVCRALLDMRVDRVFTSEAYGPGFAAALARDQGRPVEHVAFDPERRQVPISATRLRADPGLHRRFLPPPVRRALVRRVVLLGGESTGKSTLAAALADRFGTGWVPEYGRELWDLRGGALRFDDMVAIAREQVVREEAALGEANGWLFCDTSPLVTAFYSQAMFGRVAPELATLAGRAYDTTILCAPDFPFVQDGTRRDDAFRRDQNAWYAQALADRQIPFTTVAGTVTDRVEAVAKLLG
jgi:HTH-type transcriptional regulator, transcriptional repressor of NAD biosynthesis genes